MYCANCVAMHEVFAMFKDIEDGVKCPDCGKELKRMISSPAFRIEV
jgi:putative FmdB family regulatory protein